MAACIVDADAGVEGGGVRMERIKARRFKTTEQDSVEQAYQAGQRAAISGFGPDAPQNPYTDDVLRASWEAGLDDPDPSIRVATQ